ncbi:MAG: hypothetical protein KA736_06100 [Crocinitomicaceae bacterium]|nr:hypothetical protein [Crocinitomicaceae bacterium]MBP6032087.1 hypothetical protein [Crocinitomicaceae bacterium]
MKFKAQLVHIVNPEADTCFFKNESIDLIFSTISRSPELLCISLDRSRLKNVGYGLGEIHVFTNNSVQEKTKFHATQKRKEWKISICRTDAFQGIYGRIVSLNSSKIRSFIQRKSTY